MAQTADVRASDADRARVLDELARHTTAGRLNMDEYSERVAAAYRASTLAELAAIRADLPPQPDAPAAPRFDQATRVVLTLIEVEATLFKLAVMAHLAPMLGDTGRRR